MRGGSRYGGRRRRLQVSLVSGFRTLIDLVHVVHSVNPTHLGLRLYRRRLVVDLAGVIVLPVLWQPRSDRGGTVS